MRCHRVCAGVSVTAAIAPSIASAATRNTHTGITRTWLGHTTSKQSTTSIASAGGQRVSSRMGGAGSFIDVPRRARPDGPLPS
jgi:hypothetical protein